MGRIAVWIGVGALLAGLVGAAVAQPAPAGPASSPVATTDVAVGVVTKASAERIVIRIVQGETSQEITFVLDQNTTLRKGGAALAPAAVSPGDEVVIAFGEANGQRVARTVAVRPTGRVASTGTTVTGTVKSVAPERLVVLAGRPQRETAFALEKDTQITKGGATVPPSALAAGDPVQVTYAGAEGKRVAKTVVVRPAGRSSTAAAGRTAVGTVKAVAADRLLVRIPTETPPEATFLLDKDTRVVKGHDTVPATAIAPNDPVMIRYEETAGSQRLAKAVLIRMLVTAGTVKAVTPERLVLLDPAGQEVTVALDKATQVTKGTATVPPTAIAPNDSVFVNYTEADDGKRVAKTVVVRSVVEMPLEATGLVKAVTPERLVVLVGPARREVTFALGKDTQVTGSEGAAIAATALAPNDPVRVTYAEASGQQRATIVAVIEVDPSARTAMAGTVKTASSERLVVLVGPARREVTFVLDKNTRVTKARAAIPATDLAPDDQVRVVYTEAGGQRLATVVTVRPSRAAAQPAPR